MNTVCLYVALSAMVLAGCVSRPAPRKIAQVYPYTDPLSSPGAKLTALPVAVQSTIRAQAGAAEIYDIIKLATPEGDAAYAVHFSNSRVFPPLFVRADGSVLFPDLTLAVDAAEDIGVISRGPVSGIKLGDLPVKVVNTIHEQAPTAEVAFINKSTLGDRTHYEIIFRDGRHPTLLIAEDGTLIKPGP